MANDRDMLEGLVRYEYASVVWSHKIQEKQSDGYYGNLIGMEILQIVLMAFTSVGAVSLAISDRFWLAVASAALAALSLIVGIILMVFDFRRLTSSHKETANRLLRIRDELLVLLTKIHMGQGCVDALLSEFQEIESRLHEIYEKAPSTSNRAVLRAGKALNKNGDVSFSDEEIDAMLPVEIRKGRVGTD